MWSAWSSRVGWLGVGGEEMHHFSLWGLFHTTALTLHSVLMLQSHMIMGYQKAPKQNPVNVSNAKNPLSCLYPSEVKSPSFAGPFFITLIHVEEQKAWYLTWINEFFQEGNALLTGLSAHRACAWQGGDYATCWCVTRPPDSECIPVTVHFYAASCTELPCSSRVDGSLGERWTRAGVLMSC